MGGDRHVEMKMTARKPILSNSKLMSDEGEEGGEKEEGRGAYGEIVDPRAELMDVLSPRAWPSILGPGAGEAQKVEISGREQMPTSTGVKTLNVFNKRYIHIEALLFHWLCDICYV